MDEEGDDEADSSQAVADFEDDDSTIADDYEDDDDSSALPHHGLLSDREEAERKVMLEMVLGPKETAKKNPVDEKVAALVRQSLQKASAVGTSVSGTTTTTAVDTHKDDWHLAYSTTNHGTKNDMSTESSATMSTDMPPPAPIVERSNSLPDLNLMEGGTGDDDMDTST